MKRGRDPGIPFSRGRTVKAESGVTLVELLAALIISGFIVAMASKAFLSGNFQFMRRLTESQRLGEIFRVKSLIQGALKRDVTRCDGGKLRLREGDSEKDLSDVIRKRFPDISAARFQCFETVSDGASLVEWKERFQPSLVEYNVIFGKRGDADTLSGSWIK